MEIQVSSLIFQVINFLVLLFVLKKFVYKPILNLFDSRAKRIADGLKAAEQNIKLQEEMEERQQQVLAEAKSQAQKIVQEAKKQADQLVRDAQASAKAQTKKLIDKERSAATAQLKAESKQMQRQLSDTVLDATERVIGQYLDKKIDKAIVDQQIKSLSASMFN